MNEESKNLKRIKVEGFKSIEKMDLKMEQINILIGANGAGKTNLISVFTFLSNLSTGKLRNYVETEGGAERFFHFGSRHTSRILFDLEVKESGYHVEFLPNQDNDSLVFDKEFRTIPTPSVERNRNMEPSKGESGFINENPSERIDRDEYIPKYLSQCRVYHFQDTSKHASFKKTNKLVNYYYLEKDAGNIAPFLYYLKNNEIESWQQSYRRIVAAIKTVAPFFQDFYLDPVGEDGDENILLRWTHSKHDAPFSAHVLSDGTARFICLTTLFLQPESRRPDIIILDEPELGLHPVALDVLADIIHAIAKETQVICSTQSIAFANLFAPEYFIVADAKEGVSNFRRLEKDTLEQWLEEYGMGDIWSKNLIGGRPAW